MQIFGFDLAALWPFIGIGFVAQLVDGAVGMAFGVITNTLLVTGAFGLMAPLPPKLASAKVHLVEVFTTAASALSHIAHKNVDWRLFGRLAIPGVIGGCLGAYVLSNISAEIARPFVMAYLTFIGFYLLYKAWDYTHEHRQPKVIAPLGLAGGFLDAAGGGGWGPVVTSNLLIQGTSPRMTVGTVNTSEFVLTTAISVTFITQLGFAAFTIAAVGLLIGGLVAAPLGAVLAKRIAPQRLLLLVGVVLTATSLFSLYKALPKLLENF